ncbi:MAG: glyoxalase [Lachnospiraceae bacterium]|nr:glyoxalase [Lachnospiraceae bacterium]
MNFKKECLEVFLENQEQLFDEPVAETIEEADEFLDECMAIVVDSYKDLKKYFKENGGDISGMSKEEVLSQAEIFALPDGKYLIVEG